MTFVANEKPNVTRVDQSVAIVSRMVCSAITRLWPLQSISSDSITEQSCTDSSLGLIVPIRQ